MTFNKFKFKLALRVLLLLASLSVLAFLWGSRDWLFMQLITGLVIVGQVLELYHYLNATNRELAKLLLAVKHADFTINFSRKQLDGTYEGLYDVFRVLIQAYRTIKADREAQFRFLQSLIKHVDFGIIAVDARGEVLVINQPALEMLSVQPVKYWKQLAQRNPGFGQAAESLQGNSGRLAEWTWKGQTDTFSLRQTVFTVLEQPYRVISFRSMGAEIDQKELEAWNKLIRILTHEIMNTVTPIASLSDTLLRMMQQDGQLKPSQSFDEETLEDMAFSLHMIKDRSEGILHFVDDYRKLSRVPRPIMQELEAGTLLQGVYQLVQAEAVEQGVTIKLEREATAQYFRADRSLIEQVLINLIKNAMDALSGQDDKVILLSVVAHTSQLLITVTDSGPGVPRHLHKQIFVPFYSSKEEGSGIGLSLSRQIMALHGGNLYLDSAQEPGARFVLLFKKERHGSGE